MSSDPAGRAPVKVIYVMGSGHSGSTILGVALGNCPGMFFGGELNEYLARSGTPVLGGLQRTRLWREVRNRTPLAASLYGLRAHHLLERSSSVLRLHRRRRAAALRPAYRAATAQMFASLAQAAGADWIIDTSHFPQRARELQQTPGVELYVILLVRDPRPVVASVTRLVADTEAARRRRMTLRVNAELWLTHALSLSVFARQEPQRRILVHYEDLVAAPETVLGQILARFGAAPELPDLSALQTGRAIHANRLIEAERVAFKRSDGSHGVSHGHRLTAFAQRPITALLERQRPAATRTLRASGDHADAP